MSLNSASLALEARRLEAQKDVRRRQRLKQVVVRAQSDRQFQREALSQALVQISKWETGALCSPEYIAFWRNVLTSPQPFQASMELLQRRDSDARRLIGNSPFVLAV